MSDSTTTILVTGAGGQLGSRLRACAEGRPNVTFIGLGQEALDVCDRAAVFEALASHRPDVVIHAAAYTAVDRAQSEEPLAFEVNATAVRHVADACNAGGISLIHISTDYVFGDVPRRPLLPTDPTGPVGAYGRTKLAGEQAFLESGVNGALVRVAWLYDAEGHNFMNTMLRLAEAHGALKVVDDQHGCPTAVPVLADALLDMALRGADMPQGVWHFAHEGHTTWHGFATEIMRVAGWDVPVEPVGSEAFPTPAQRPAWSVLDGGPLREQMGWPKCTWEDALAQVWALKQAGG
ncbi:MAG: dTDP-4-dehydrorhamnose reductase [Bacteroidota bacterium]|nr:dTDP-4-dehydrorhamnose reductase [Bacteroidota bacterium]